MYKRIIGALLLYCISACALCCTTGGGSTVCLTATGNSSSIALAWTVSGNTLSGIEVYRDTDSNPNGRTRIASQPTSSRGYTDSNISAGITYYYWIKFSVGGASYNSNSGSASTSTGTSTASCGVRGSSRVAACSGDPAVCLLGGNTGHYRVSMGFNSSYTGAIEVFAESRRKMFTDGQKTVKVLRCADFLVNVRDPEGQPIQDVERGQTGLNLRITSGGSALTSLYVEEVTDAAVLFIAGDSTVADQQPQLDLALNSRFTGWGQAIPKFFGDRISVSNYADSGESTAAFRTDGGSLWKMIDSRLKPNDWVLIQLGHNDKTTSAATYRTRVLGMINAIRKKGAYPVLITPMVRNNGQPLAAQHIWGDLNIRNELISLSNSENVPLVDLMKVSSEWALGLGKSTAQAYFVVSDGTHSNGAGADLFAGMIVKEMRKMNIGLNDYLR